MPASHSMQIVVRKLVNCFSWRAKQPSVLEHDVTANRRHFKAQKVESVVSTDSITDMSNTERLSCYWVSQQSYY